MRAAVAAGDAVAGPVQANLAGWFAHHLSVGLATYLAPAKPIVDYDVGRQQVMEQAVWFILRGMGVSDRAIRKPTSRKASPYLFTDALSLQVFGEYWNEESKHERIRVERVV